MPDMLVRLYELPELQPPLRRVEAQDVRVRVAMSYEKPTVIEWVRQAFGAGWGAECEMAFRNVPISCFIATEQGQLRGFACYDSTCRDYFGPVGVDANARDRGIGTALLLSCLHTMATLGYAYAIIGAVHDTGYYRKAVGATVIEGSSPGIYRDRLK